MKRMCPAHGMVETVFDGTCAVCGAPTLDEANPAHRAELAEMAKVRRATSVRIVLGIVLPLGLLAVPITLALVVKTQSLDILFGVPLSLVVVAITGALAYRRPGFLTSTTLALVALCALFILVKAEVGVQTLWFHGFYLEQPHRVLTATLTHGGFIHFASNMLALLAFAPLVESRVGRLGTLAILASGGLAGMVAHSMSSDVPAVGASAAVFGIFGATLALFPTEERVLRLQDVAIPMPVWLYMLVVIVTYTLVDATNPHSNVAWGAHLGGFVGGLVAAIPLRSLPESAASIAAREAQREHNRFAMAAALVPIEIVAAPSPGSSLEIPIDTDSEPSPASTIDRHIDEFHRSGRRRGLIAQLVGGGLFLVIGVVAAGLAAYLEAPGQAAGRRFQVIIAGVMMTAVGIGMLVQGLRKQSR